MANVQYSGVRESRPGRVNDLGTTGKEVEENYKKGCLKRADRSFAQGLQCQQINSMAALMSLEDSVFVSHSPQGCVGCTIMAVDMYRVGQAHRGIKYIKNPRIIVTNIDQKSVVFGGEQKLRDSVKKAVERYSPKVIFIYASCASGIIGDDIVSVTEEFQDQGYEVYPIETPGFAGDSNLGYETIWNTMIDKVIEKDVPKNDKLVNIFGIVPYHDPFWSGTLEEIDRILSRLGLTVNTFFTKDQGIETIKKCSGAALNIIINPWLFKGPARKFEQKFGVPSIRIPGLPIGATDTTAFVRAVAEALNLDQALVDSVIESEEAYVYNYLAQAIGVVSWKRFAVVADANNAVGLTRYLANDFSFTPVLVVISEPMFRQEDKDRVLAQIENLEYAVPPKVIFTADQYDVNQAILNEEKEITLILGSSNDREVALTKDCQFILTSFPMNERLVFNRTYAGYRGSLTFTEDLYDNL